MAEDKDQDLAEKTEALPLRGEKGLKARIERAEKAALAKKQAKAKEKAKAKKKAVAEGENRRKELNRVSNIQNDLAFERRLKTKLRDKDVRRLYDEGSALKKENLALKEEIKRLKAESK